MNIILEKFKTAKNKFNKDRLSDSGCQVMQKIVKIVNDLGNNWNGYNGGDLAYLQMKLAGYKFYLIDYLSDLNRISEQLKLELKQIKAEQWDEISETIKAEKGKVQNKDQIENILVIKTREIQTKQILYETMYNQYRLKIYAIDDILTAIVQQIAMKKRELETVKSMQ